MNVVTKLRYMGFVLQWWGKFEKDIFPMKLSVNAILQALMLALQMLNQAQDMLPPKGKFWAMIAISALQGVVAVLSHFSNPDGTPASTPYVKDTKLNVG